MNKKKLIKRCKSGDTVEKSDNTKVQMPRTDVEPIKIPDEELKWMGWRERTYPNGETYMEPPLANGALTPVYPEFELLTGLRGLLGLNRITFNNITINGKPLTPLQKNQLLKSRQQLIKQGSENPTITQIVNNSEIGYMVPEGFYSGVNATKEQIKNFKGNIWMSNDKDVYTYFSNRNYPGSNNITNKFQAGFPKKANIKEIDFDNKGFRGTLDSDEVLQSAVEEGFDVVKQNNIVELTKPGTNIIIPEGTDRLIISNRPKYKYFDLDWLKFNLFK